MTTDPASIDCLTRFLHAGLMYKFTPGPYEGRSLVLRMVAGPTVAQFECIGPCLNTWTVVRNVDGTMTRDRLTLEAEQWMYIKAPNSERVPVMRHASRIEAMIEAGRMIIGGVM